MRNNSSIESITKHERKQRLRWIEGKNNDGASNRNELLTVSQRREQDLA